MKDGKGKGPERGRGGPWKPFLSVLSRSMTLEVALALGLTICLGLTEGVGLLLLVPLLGLVGLDLAQGALGGLARIVPSVFAAGSLSLTLSTVLASYVLVVGISALLYRWQTLVNLGFQHRLVATLRERLYRSINGTSWIFFCRSRSSDFTHHLTVEVERAGAAVYHLLQLLVTSVLALVYLLFAWKLSFPCTALVLACGLALILALRGKVRTSRAAGKGLSGAMGGLYAAVSEHLGGMKTVKSHGIEERHAEVFAGLAGRVRHFYLRAVRSQADLKCLFDIGSVLVMSLVVSLAVSILATPPADLLFLIYLFARILPRLSSLAQGYQGLVNLLPAFASIVEMEERCLAAAEGKPRAREKAEFRRSLRLDRVSFGYEDRPVIRDLELEIRAGETAAIVGPSGAGKSTVADLMIGLIAPDSGRVLVDGVPLTPERIASWKEKVGYVGQDTFLFHDTVRANLLWASPGATEGEMRKAIELAAAEEFVSRLPRGLDTVLGDRGDRLSGGERQRLSLARALLRRPSLLVLDEATSNLDSENELRIQEAVERLHGSMTIVMISHRLTCVRRSDAIHVLAEGRLVESGSWGELISNQEGRLRSLYGEQILAAQL